MLVAIEQGIKDVLQQFKQDGHEYIRTIASYGGEFDDDLAVAVRSFPAIWVTFAGAAPIDAKRSSQIDDYEMTFVVIVGARSGRNEEAARHGLTIGGEQIEVGSYQLLSDAMSVLHKSNLGLSISKLKAGKVATLFNTKIRSLGLSVLTQEYTCTGRLFNLPEDTDSPLLRIGTDYRDPVADVSLGTQLIELEQ